METERPARISDGNLTMKKTVSRKWKDPIPVLVFACNRSEALRDHVESLLKYRPSKELFPIIVSQDCDDQYVHNEVMEFEDQIEYIKHSVDDNVSPKYKNFLPYYRIARHYKLALDHVFVTEGYESVIITEDDLQIAPDFFSYFSNTRYLLDMDPTLMCVTAWNDNGKPTTMDITDVTRLYRTDFLAGLGWMMTSRLWKEIGPKWPVMTWDDWLRNPLRRKGRQCIRPEVGRTGMSFHGQEGASSGQFFLKYLMYIEANTGYTDFGKIDLDYLLPENFEKKMKKEVESAIEMDIDDAVQFVHFHENRGKSIRIMYGGRLDYINKADAFEIMHDFKSGVPRTAYNGIVTCFYKGVRVYLVPDRTRLSAYDPKWIVPPEA
uniref:Alpha-1,3-mannosyl-glycoprotein 2-beta-N-acetylglucosaminyltransferase n=1 Tax=Caenorhabditis japonica TaxID=281687 RepID=A0A8R1E352_CAEJA